MTLEDFFTLTEMRDGLTAPARVKELVTVMQKEKDCVVKNVGELTRQWSTVASTIAATENKDCLDLFIQLDGLWFIDRWLKDAQKFSNDTSDSFVEESITALLQALEKLHIDNEKSISSGIWMTVKKLLGHNSSRIQDRARSLFDSWKQDREGDAISQDVEKVEALHDDGINVVAHLTCDSGHPECSSRDVSLMRRGVNEEKRVEPARDEMMPSICSDAVQLERVDDVQMLTSDKTSDHAVMKGGPPGPVSSSVLLKPVYENLSTKEEPPIYCSEGSTLIETSSPTVPSQGNLDGWSDVPELNKHTDDTNQMQKIRSSPEKLGVTENSSVSCPFKHRNLPSSADAKISLDSATEPDFRKNDNAKDEDPCAKVSPSGDLRTIMPEGKSRVDDRGSPDHCSSTPVLRTTHLVSECGTDFLQDSSGNECKLEKSEDLETSFSRRQDVVVDEEVREHASDEGEDDLTNDSNFLKPAIDARDPELVDKRSDFERDYGMVDPLEVARQVAIEVEREVVDCREPSCSSSEKISGDGIGQPDSPDSTNGKQSQLVEGPPEEIPTGPHLSTNASPMREEPLHSKEDLGSEPENCMQDMESSQVTEAAQEPEANTEKGLCEFDLNQEVCSEDTDRPLNLLSTPISVVSASRAAAAPGLPVAPLQFEGSLGWKGSAATSAFRPASPRRIPEGDKSTLGSHSSSKQWQDCLGIDLNVAEGGEDKMADLIPRKQLPILPGFPLGESSVDASPRRAERLNLDLNRVSDDGDAPSDWRLEGRSFQHRNGHHSLSPSSSSSSMQPSLRNIDLNDQPSLFNDPSYHPYLGKSAQNVNVSAGLKSDEFVISIMGTRVEVNRNEFVHPLPLPNGRILEPAMDLNLARPGGAMGMESAVPYARSAVYGYNGLTQGPTMPFSSAMYGPGGPIPYMVDSRGAPVVPQIVGSASALPPTFSQSPFVTSMSGTPSSSNGPGPSRHNFDLNSGLLMIEGGNRESGGLRQHFNPGPGRSLDEHLRTNLQPSSSSGIGGKRKEPESGWETYPFNYKHHQPPWK